MRHQYNPINKLIKYLIYSTIYRHRSKKFHNIENLKEWNFTLRAHHHHSDGISAMLRVKNESSKICLCLDTIHDLFDEIIVINNCSTDNTRELVENFIKTKPSTKVKLLEYPHQIARCGSDHHKTPENSIHSLAYYYNWCLSKCTRRWIFKWDADMIIPSSRIEFAKSVIEEIKNSKLTLWNIQGQTVYIDKYNKPWASISEINHEERAFPNSTMIHYHKAEKWERLKSPLSLQEQYPEGVFFYELKNTNEDEFSNWSQTTEMSPRKKIEFQNYTLIKDGVIDREKFRETTLP